MDGSFIKLKTLLRVGVWGQNHHALAGAAAQ